MKRPVVPKDYRKFYIEASNQKILEVFFKFPDKEFSLSDLAKEAGVSKAHVSFIVEELEKAGLISIEKLTKIWRIKADQKSGEFIKHKIIYNLNFIYSSGLVEFLNEHFKNPSAIILFGSFRKGEDISHSDIDIAIESRETKGYQILELDELREFESIIRRKIQVHLFNKKAINVHVFNNISNGITLLGFLEVKP